MKQVQKDNYQMVQKGQIVRSKGPNDKRGTSNFCTGEYMSVREWYDFTIALVFCIAFIYVVAVCYYNSYSSSYCYYYCVAIGIQIGETMLSSPVQLRLFVLIMLRVSGRFCLPT